MSANFSAYLGSGSELAKFCIRIRIRILKKSETLAKNQLFNYLEITFNFQLPIHKYPLTVKGQTGSEHLYPAGTKIWGPGPGHPRSS